MAKVCAPTCRKNGAVRLGGGPLSVNRVGLTPVGHFRSTLNQGTFSSARRECVPTTDIAVCQQQSGTRKNDAMSVIAPSLSDTDIEDLAAYFSAIEINVVKMPGG